jgi:hypothetical protein
MEKVFWFFFSKKNTFLLAALVTAAATPPPIMAPDQARAQEMILIYEEFCLGYFPNQAAIEAAARTHQMTPLTPAEAAGVLLGRQGEAWRVVTPKGSYSVAIETGGRQGCAVTGEAADDDGIRAAFDLAVTSFAGGHEFGALDKPAVRHVMSDGQALALQLIGATPDGRPRQAFVNMSRGVQVRLTREFAPPGK